MPEPTLMLAWTSSAFVTEDSTDHLSKASNCSIPLRLSPEVGTYKCRGVKDPEYLRLSA